MTRHATLTFEGRQIELPIVEGSEGELAVDISELAALPKVDIVYSYADSTAVVAQALVKSGAKGLVYEPLQMIPADNLKPQKARILLMLALTRTHDLNEIARIFTEY